MNTLSVAQITIGILLIFSILLQQRGSIMSDNGAGVYKRRGAERILLQGSIVLAILFTIVSILNSVVLSQVS